MLELTVFYVNGIDGLSGYSSQFVGAAHAGDQRRAESAVPRRSARADRGR